MAKIVKCISCGIYNENRDYCKNCGALVSHKKRRQLQIKAEKKKRFEAVKKEPPGFIEKLRRHRFFIYRVFGWVLYSAFAIISAIGAFIAWLVFAIAAG